MSGELQRIRHALRGPTPPDPIPTRPDIPQDKAILRVSAGTELIGSRIVCCRAATSRRNGLLGAESLAPDQGVLLVMPRLRRGRAGLLTSITTIGMAFPVAAAWLDGFGRVVHAVLARRGRPVYASPHPAHYILEVHPFHQSTLQLGVQVCWQQAASGDSW